MEASCSVGNEEATDKPRSFYQHQLLVAPRSSQRRARRLSQSTTASPCFEHVAGLPCDPPARGDGCCSIMATRCGCATAVLLGAQSAVYAGCNAVSVQSMLSRSSQPTERTRPRRESTDGHARDCRKATLADVRQEREWVQRGFWVQRGCGSGMVSCSKKSEVRTEARKRAFSRYGISTGRARSAPTCARVARLHTR